LDGVRPLARDLDTVGPMARDVAGVIAGLTLLEPGFTPAPSAPRTVGVLAVDADPRITAAARRVIARWRETLDALWTRVDLLATPTLLGFPPLLDEAHRLFKLRVLTSPVNAAGVPSLALPVPVRGRNAGPFPASIQLIGPRYSEEKLLAAGLRLEQAVGG
ncbi:MAG TPA: amidase family protein, partial [Trebonia sp.]